MLIKILLLLKPGSKFVVEVKILLRFSLIQMSTYFNMIDWVLLWAMKYATNVG